MSGLTHGGLPSAALRIRVPRLLHRAKPSVVNQLELTLTDETAGP